MIITHHGAEFFKVQFGDLVLAFNPISKASKLDGARFGADIAFVTTPHNDLNGVDSVSRADREPFVISGPGEYEIGGIFIRGFASETKYDGVSFNTIYTLTLEGMNLCFLGALSKKELPQEVTEALDAVDILFIPVGGEGVLEPAVANTLAVSIEPKIIIPMHYEGVGKQGALKVFLKEAGATDVKPIDKLTLKRKDLEGKDGEVIVLDKIS